jgi:hypothetical protein
VRLSGSAGRRSAAPQHPSAAAAAQHRRGQAGSFRPAAAAASQARSTASALQRFRPAAAAAAAASRAQSLAAAHCSLLTACWLTGWWHGSLDRTSSSRQQQQPAAAVTCAVRVQVERCVLFVGSIGAGQVLPATVQHCEHTRPGARKRARARVLCRAAAPLSCGS